MLKFILVFLICVVAICRADGIRFTHNVFDYELYENSLNAEQCRADLSRMNSFEFYDASFRIPQGIMQGNFYGLGNYHQCLQIRQTFDQDPDVEGKYCMINVPLAQDSITLPSLPSLPEWNITLPEWNITLPELNITWPGWNDLPKLTITWPKEMRSLYRTMKAGFAVETGHLSRVSSDSSLDSVSLSLAVCIPKTCTVYDVLSPYVNNSLVKLDYEEEFCRLPNDKPFVVVDYVAAVIFSVLALLTVVSTGYDVHQILILKKNPKETSKLLTCCSVYINTKRFLTFTSNPNVLDCLEGLRSLSILWIVVGHTFTAYMANYLANILELIEWTTKVESLWIISANISVDTFFVLSGLLLVYTNVRKMKSMTLVKNLHLFYIYRLLRMFPLLAAAVLLQASVFHRVADGVNWHHVGGQVQSCRQYWWTTLLHVQNIVNPKELCLPHTWYLSVDMQLYVLSPLVLFWVLRGRRAAWSSLTISLLVSTSALTIFCFIMDFPPLHWNTVMSDPDRVMNYEMYYYNNTLSRAPVFVIGMFIGYLLHVVRDVKVTLPWWFFTSAYALWLLIFWHCMYYVHYVMQPGWDNQLVDNLINSFMRPTWALSLGWLIFACVKGYGGPINWFLSLHIWKFVGRISYAMYIFHYPYQYMNAGTMIAPFVFSVGNVWTMYASDVVFTMMISIAACIIIDAPCSTLQKLLLGGGSKPKPQKPMEANGHDRAPSTNARDNDLTTEQGIIVKKL